MGPCFSHGNSLAFLRPLGENPFAQLTNLLDGSGFGFMRATALPHQLIDPIGEIDQPLPQVGFVRVTLVQAPKGWFGLSRK